jgi:hypothetical protein
MDKNSQIKAFYKLKAQYDKQNKIVRSKILHNKLLDKHTKKISWNSYKKTCIHCKKPVGTIFSTKNNRLIARCGAVNSSTTYTPCDLNIDITLDKHKLISEVLDDNIMTKEVLEHEMNLNKLDLIFNYEEEDDILDKFEKIKKKYVKNKKQHLTIIKQLDNVISENKEESKLQASIDQYINESRELSVNKEENLDILSAYNIDIKNKYQAYNKEKYKDYYMNKNKLIKRKKSMFNTSIII